MNTPNRHSRGPVALLMALLVGLAAVGGCSVSTNDHPVAASDIFDGLVQVSTSTTSTTTPEDVTRPATLYFLRSQSNGAVRLEPVERQVDVDADIPEILRNLFTTPLDPVTRPAEAGLTSAIGDTAQLLSAERLPGTTQLVVNVAGLFENTEGRGLRNALAQIVWTATVPSDITEVSFQNNGAPVAAIVGNGETVEGPVDRSDYSTLT